MEFKLIKKDPIENKSEVLVFGMFSNERIKGNLLNADKALGNVLHRIFEQEKFTGDIGKSLMINTLGKLLAERVLIIGLGKRSKLDPDVLRKMAIVAAKKTIPFSKHPSARGSGPGHLTAPPHPPIRRHRRCAHHRCAKYTWNRRPRVLGFLIDARLCK